MEHKRVRNLLHRICSSGSVNHGFVLLRLLPHLVQVIRTPQSVITASYDDETLEQNKDGGWQGVLEGELKNFRLVPTAPAI